MTHQTETTARLGRILACPKCHGNLIAEFSGQVEVGVCSEGCGTWVNILQEKEFWDLKPEVFTVDELLQFRKNYEGLGPVGPLRYINCPVCSQLMNRKVWGSYSGVFVDRCQAHGTWYGKEETEKIREYIQKGGVEYEKFCRSESGLSDLGMRLSHLETRLESKINNLHKRSYF